METKTDTGSQSHTTTVLAPVRVDPAFLSLLQQHRRGDCLDELGVALRELNTAVQLTGKGGTLTLTIAVKPNSGVRGAVQIKDKIKATLPKIEADASLFYVNKDGALQRDDPNQTHLDLRVVQGGPDDGGTELRRVS